MKEFHQNTKNWAQKKKGSVRHSDFWQRSAYVNGTRAYEADLSYFTEHISEYSKNGFRGRLS